MRVLLFALTAFLAVGCGQKPGAADTGSPDAGTPAPAGPGPDQTFQPASAGPQAVEGQIDWDTARTDFSRRPADQQNVQVQSAGEDGPSPVPMLLPSGVVQIQTDRPVPPVVTKDGYFATYHLPKFDAIVNGSNKAYQAGGQAAPGDKEAMRFMTGEASASLSFSRYGADYTIDFECRQVDGGESCITEDEAREFAESLFVAQTR